MGDVLMVAFMFAAFALAWLLVKVCDRIIGPAELTVVDGGFDEDERDRGRGLMPYDNAVALIISILVAGYLVYALVAPEKL